MLDHILVPLDGSQFSEAALHYATEIISPTGTITLVTAVDLPDTMPYGFYAAHGAVVDPVSPSTMKDEYYNPSKVVKDARLYLQQIIQNRLNVSNSLTFNLEASVSDAATLVVDTARKYKVDAIVMSTHGRSGLTRWIFGSVTQRVLSQAPCPVFVVPNTVVSADGTTSSTEMSYS